MADNMFMIDEPTPTESDNMFMVDEKVETPKPGIKKVPKPMTRTPGFNPQAQMEDFYGQMLGTGKYKREPGRDINPIPRWEGPNEGENPMQIDENTAWLDALNMGLSRVPSSSMKLLRDAVNAITHPLDTASSVAGIGSGLAMKAVPGKQPNEKYVDDLVSQMKSRYGSVQNFKKTMGNDPIGVLTDISTVLIPAGKALNASKIGKVSKVGDVLTKAGSGANPMNIPGRIPKIPIKGRGTNTNPKMIQQMGNVVEKVPGAKTVNKMRDPKQMMREGLNLDKKMDPKTADNITNKALDNNLGRNNKSIERLETIIDNETKRIDKMIADGGDNLIDTSKFKPLISQIRKDTRFADDKANVDRIIKNFNDQNVSGKILDSKGNAFPKQVTAKKAKELIDDLNDHLKDMKKKELDPVPQNVRVALRNRVSKALEDVIPGLDEATKNLDEYITLKNALSEASNGIDPKLLYSAVSTGAKAMATGPKSGILDVVKAVFQTPKVKIAAANLMNKLKSGGYQLKPTSQAIALGLITPERYNIDGNIKNELEDKNTSNEENENLIKKTISNIPSSTFKALQDTIDPVIHPIETLQSMVGLGVGVLQKAIPGEQSKEVYADALMNYYRDRYKSSEDFKKAISEDPIGVLSDATIFAGGGAILGVGKLGKASKIAKKAKKAKPELDWIEKITGRKRQPGKDATPSELAKWDKYEQDYYNLQMIRAAERFKSPIGFTKKDGHYEVSYSKSIPDTEFSKKYKKYLLDNADYFDAYEKP